MPSRLSLPWRFCFQFNVDADGESVGTRVGIFETGEDQWNLDAAVLVDVEERFVALVF